MFVFPPIFIIHFLFANNNEGATKWKKCNFYGMDSEQFCTLCGVISHAYTESIYDG